MKRGGSRRILLFVGRLAAPIVGDAAAALAASDTLRDHGFLVIAIRPPTVPADTARLRFAFTAQHDDRDIARLAEIVRQQVLRR